MQMQMRFVRGFASSPNQMKRFKKNHFKTLQGKMEVSPTSSLLLHTYHILDLKEKKHIVKGGLNLMKKSLQTKLLCITSLHV